MKQCKHIEKDGFHECGSYAFNLRKDGIDQGDLCNVHYWQNKSEAIRLASALERTPPRTSDYDNVLQVIKELRPIQNNPLVKDKPASWWLDKFEEAVKQLKEKST